MESERGHYDDAYLDRLERVVGWYTERDYHVMLDIPDQQMKMLETDGILTSHDYHGEWNYSLNPAHNDTTTKPRSSVTDSYSRIRVRAGGPVSAGLLVGDRRRRPATDGLRPATEQDHHLAVCSRAVPEAQFHPAAADGTGFQGCRCCPEPTSSSVSKTL